MVELTALSSDWTLLRVCGDFERAAENAALEYLRAIELAARRPKPAEKADERATVSMMGGKHKEDVSSPSRNSLPYSSAQTRQFPGAATHAKSSRKK